MADWVNITDAQVDPDAPLTSELAYAWRDNPIAIAEGAVGAPRVQWRAWEKSFIAAVSSALTTPVAVTGIGDVGMLYLDINANSSSGSPSINIGFSNDGGSTWGANQTLSFGTVITAGVNYRIYLNLQTGKCDGAYVQTNGTYAIINTTFTVPSNCNAIRFSGSGSTFAAGAYRLSAAGGRY